MVLQRVESLLCAADRSREGICAVGFEPNPSHEEALRELQAAYNKCGWRTDVFTGTAVAVEDGVAVLELDKRPQSIGATLVAGTIPEVSDAHDGAVTAS